MLNEILYLQHNPVRALFLRDYRRRKVYSFKIQCTMNLVAINIYIILTNCYKFIFMAAKKRRVYETAVKIFRNGQLLTGVLLLWCCGVVYLNLLSYLSVS